MKGEICGDQQQDGHAKCVLPKGHEAHWSGAGTIWYPAWDIIDAELAAIERIRALLAAGPIAVQLGEAYIRADLIRAALDGPGEP